MLAVLRWVGMIVAILCTWRVFGDYYDAHMYEYDGHSLNDRQLRRLHGHMDADKDGQLSLKETLKYATEVARSIAKKDIQPIIEEIDTSKDGLVSLEEHLADIQNQAQGGDEEEMRELAHHMDVEKAKFLAADGNHDNHLEAHEIVGLFYPETHDGVLNVTAQETFRRKDKDGDGRLSPTEFLQAGDSHINFEGVDTNRDGFLNLEEIRLWEAGPFHTQDAMEKLFQVADYDYNMHLSVNELARARYELSISDAQYHLIEWAEHHEL